MVIQLKYGTQSIPLEVSDKNLINVLDVPISDTKIDEESIILNALKKPIASAQLSQLVKPGETVCIVVSDITRLWQKMYMWLKFIVAELKKGGIKDDDITFLFATGSHNTQTDDESKKVLGNELYNKYKFVSNDCNDKGSFIFMGYTTYGTPVYLNKIAVESDHVVLTGSITYHFLVGWAGGRKSVVPGIAGYETIMHNHGLSLSDVIGKGTLPQIKSGNNKNNPVHEDMLQAASMLNPSFLFNVIIDTNGKVCAAVAGNHIKAFEHGCEIVDKMDRIFIDSLSDVVIASASGYPKDMNLYQSSKSLMNAVEAVKPGGTLILIAKCNDGIGGDDDIKDIIENYSNTFEREKCLRERYSISKYVGYYISDIADKYNLIIVTDLDEKLLKNTNVKVVQTLDAAMNAVNDKYGDNYSLYVIPHSASVMPTLK